MKVKNDFPNADVVLRRLREYVSFFEEKKKKATDSTQIEDCEYLLKHVDNFITAISNYLDSVCNASDRIQRARQECNDVADIRSTVQTEDENRTRYHSTIIRTMVMIDRVAIKYGLAKVFDYAGEFEKNYAALTPNTIQEKSKMPEAARVKRREMGNFGLYIAATVTAGMNKDIMLTDDEARQFASCESGDLSPDHKLYQKVKESSKGVKKNMEDIVK